MDMEKLRERMLKQVENLTPGRLMAYFFGWITCCVMATIALNIMLPAWARWYKRGDFWGAILVLCISGSICIIAEIMSD